MYAIEAKNLNKIYAANKKTRSPEKHALKDFDIQIPRGSIYGLLGPNGAGKSTFINILASLVMKTSGEVKIWESDIDSATRQARASIGIVPQEINLDPFFTPAQALDMQAGLYGVPKVKRRTEELLELVGLSDKANAYARSLSGGMKRRLMIAKALVHTPPILILDEPTAGVDVELRQMLWQNVRALNKAGTTILLTTHYLEEAEELCDHIAIINHGKKIKDTTKDRLIGQIESKELLITLAEATAPRMADLFKDCFFSNEGKNKVLIRYNPADINAGDIIERIRKKKNTIIDISTQEPDLEDVFLSLTRSK
ncbi:MAG: ABC transporter ATP-binding protein [Alphaproteobacteria bacterium]|nr:ABC transporter ATP-binding protein [Alphaproteobacteria bacterium]